MENWRDNFELADEIKTNPTLLKYETPEAAFQGLIEANSRLGRSLTVPTENDTPETRAEFRKKLQNVDPNLIVKPDPSDEEANKAFWEMAGVPDDVKAYEPPEKVEGMTPEQIEDVRQLALKSGWTKKQFRDTVANLDSQAVETAEAHQQMIEQDQGLLKEKWGQAEDSKRKTIDTLITKFQDPEHKLGELNAAALLLLDNIAKEFQGGGTQATTQPLGQNGMTPSEIADEQAKIRTQMLSEGRAMGKEKYSRLIQKLEALGKMAAQ